VIGVLMAAVLQSLPAVAGPAATGSNLERENAVQQVGDNCCDCAPSASDQECFAECNAMLPRCRPAAPRPHATTPSRQSAPAQSGSASCPQYNRVAQYCCRVDSQGWVHHANTLHVIPPTCPGAPCIDESGQNGIACCSSMRCP